MRQIGHFMRCSVGENVKSIIAKETARWKSGSLIEESGIGMFKGAGRWEKTSLEQD